MLVSCCYPSEGPLLILLLQGKFKESWHVLNTDTYALVNLTSEDCTQRTQATHMHTDKHKHKHENNLADSSLQTTMDTILCLRSLRAHCAI